MQTQTLVFFGMIGSGKGTQISLLRDFLDKKGIKENVYVGTGEGFRRLVRSDNYTSNLVRDSLLRGELQPDFLATSFVVESLTSKVSPEKHLIIDGYPRTVAQSKEFEKMMKFYRRKSVKMIYIEISKEEATRRNLLRGREDDTKEGIAKRLDEHVDNVIPAMEYLKDKGEYELLTINGEQTISEVHEDIIKALKF